MVALGPPLLIGIAGWMTGFFGFSEKRLMLLGLSVAPYLTLFAFRLRRSFGGLGPDVYGD
jgi:hypothetical protein